jgi:hypothetical protein
MRIDKTITVWNIWEDEVKKDIDKTMERFFKHIDSKIRNESVV